MVDLRHPNMSVIATLVSLTDESSAYKEKIANAIRGTLSQERCIEIAVLRKIDGNCQAEIDRKHQAAMDRQKGEKIKRGWDTSTKKNYIHILYLQLQLYFALYIPSYYYFVLCFLYFASLILLLHILVA